MSRKNNTGIGSLTLVFISFVFGYLFANYFDVNQMTSWVNNNVASKNAVQANNAAESLQAKKEKVKPKLEFYTLLSQDNMVRENKTETTVAIKEPDPPKDIEISQNKQLPLPKPFVEENNEDKPIAKVLPANKFIIQVGSFKIKSEAEKMRAGLLIKGFAVSITESRQAQTNWYRVMIGPFESRVEAQKLQTTIVRTENINGMVKKVDA